MNRAVKLFAIAMLCLPAIARGDVTRDAATPTPAAMRRLLDDAADGRFDQHTLLEAALIASGASPRLAVASSRRQTDSANAAADITAQLESIHRRLHAQYLTGPYHVEATQLDETLSTGRYNCVTASILFIELARREGFTAHAVQLPEHVRCEVIADGMAIACEPTSTNSYRATSTTGRPRVLSDVQLVATIFYNRGVAVFDAGDYMAAIELNRQALALDPDCGPARDNLLAAINNRVVGLIADGAKTSAAALLDEGERIEPRYPPFEQNRQLLDR